MLREASMAHESDWGEKTMSMLREKQYEACERRLSSFPSVNLFSPDANDIFAQDILEASFFANEPGNDGLATIATLRDKVLAMLPTEVLYLSRGESDLLERLLVSNGQITSGNWDVIDAAEALMRRLWCSFTDQDEKWTLTIAQPLMDPLIKALHNPQIQEIKSRLFRYNATMHGLLYIAGFLPAEQPVSFFIQDVIDRQDTLAVNIANRYIKASFEYTDDENGGLVIMHPGLADPDKLITMIGLSGDLTLSLSEETLAGGMNGILPEEEPLQRQMAAALEGLVRPECDADETAEDLRLLAKQGVSLTQMEAVLAATISVLPTPAMKDAVRQMYDRTPHWIGMAANLQH